MREIKFRVWDRKVKPRLFEEGIFVGLDGNLYGQTYDDMEKLDGFIMEQFTGLKDKNGVDIYEGDILKHSKYPGKLYLVYWAEGTGFYPFINTLGAKYATKSIEVIGNIHQNPELLK